MVDEAADDRVALAVGVVLGDGIDQSRGIVRRVVGVGLAKPSALPLMWKNNVPSLLFQP